MLNKLNELRNSKDEGFTLIELLVVIAIIGVLAAIALPVFISQQAEASKASVKSDAHNTATSIATYLVSNPGVETIPETLKVATDNNVIKITGGAYNYTVCVSDPDYTTYTFGFDSTTGQFTEGCDITGATGGNGGNNGGTVTPPVVLTPYEKAVSYGFSGDEIAFDDARLNSPYSGYTPGQFVAFYEDDIANGVFVGTFDEWLANANNGGNNGGNPTGPTAEEIAAAQQTTSDFLTGITSNVWVGQGMHFGETNADSVFDIWSGIMVSAGDMSIQQQVFNDGTGFGSVNVTNGFVNGQASYDIDASGNWTLTFVDVQPVV